LNNETTLNEKKTVTSTFKDRIINGHSVENRKAKRIKFIISHRFSEMNLGFDELFFGLDQSNIRLLLDMV
jgi:hypothetical protein